MNAVAASQMLLDRVNQMMSQPLKGEIFFPLMAIKDEIQRTRAWTDEHLSRLDQEISDIGKEA